MPSNVNTKNRFDRIRCFALIILSVACGPALNEPSSDNITGHWTSSDHLGPVFDIAMDITQKADGTVTGTWSSLVSPPHPSCPPDIGDTANGPVDGSNSAVGLLLSLKGAGDFQGQVNSTTISGSLFSCGHTYPVTFSLASPVAGG